MQPEYLVALRRFLSHTDPLTMPSGEVPDAAHGFDNKVHQDHRDFAEDEQWGIAGDSNWRIGDHTVRSLTGYRKWSNGTLNESVIRLPMDLIRRVTFYDVETISQELQLLSPTGGLRWTDSNKDGSFLSLVNNPISAPPSPANPFTIDLRIPEEHPDLEYDEEELTWLANISYSPVENLMLFATYATGFRSGGFNPEGFDSVAEAAGADRVYETETVDNIEIGVKGGLFDSRAVVNLNYFHTQIDDLNVQCAT